MKTKKIDAVEFKVKLQKKAEKKIANLSVKEQVIFFQKKYGHLLKKKGKRSVA
ncbi:MAG: hypothetical protein KJ666_12340 [Bacteroidetes bacterium]|nr:hypothetical protein [Bacteroidota bacterium]MBU2584038.1 hypothetical protein [Bacteroidota bacterium]